MKIQPGDLLGFCGNSSLSQFIILNTYGIPWWSLSHIAIAADLMGDTVFFESTSVNPDPCMIQGKCVKGVQVHSLASLDNYDAKIWHYPLRRSLNQKENKDLTDFLMSTVGKSYDYIGAFRSGAKVFSWIESKLHEENLHNIFCSELCAAAHREINRFNTNNVSRWSPNALIREEYKQAVLNSYRRIR